MKFSLVHDRANLFLVVIYVPPDVFLNNILTTRSFFSFVYLILIWMVCWLLLNTLHISKTFLHFNCHFLWTLDVLVVLCLKIIQKQCLRRSNENVQWIVYYDMCIKKIVILSYFYIIIIFEMKNIHDIDLLWITKKWLINMHELFSIIMHK